MIEMQRPPWAGLLGSFHAPTLGANAKEMGHACQHCCPLGLE